VCFDWRVKFLFTFSVIAERYLLTTMSLLLFFQVGFSVDGPLLLACSSSGLVDLMIWSCLIYSCLYCVHQVSFEFYSFLASYVCDFFSSSSMWNILSSIFCGVDSVDLNHCSLSLSLKVLISVSKLKDCLLDIIFLTGSFSQFLNYIAPCFPGILVCDESSEVILMCFHCM
jgi:hypothetical protein